MSDPEISNAELGRQLVDFKAQMATQLVDLKAQMSTGFGGTHTRLDRVNGQLDTHREKLATHATALGEHRVKISTLNNRVFRRRAGEDGEASGDDEVATKGESKPITRGDLVFAGGVVFALVEVVRWLPALVAIGRVAP